MRVDTLAGIMFLESRFYKPDFEDTDVEKHSYFIAEPLSLFTATLPQLVTWPYILVRCIICPKCCTGFQLFRAYTLTSAKLLSL